MIINFSTNDYLLAWYLLFKPSISEEIQNLKVRLYKNYGREYMMLEKENIEILKYNHDFIPDDDTIYNIVFDTDIFKKLKKETEQYRQKLMGIWDSNQKKVLESAKEILRIKPRDKYNVIVVHPNLDIIEYVTSNPVKNIVWGKPNDKDDTMKTLMRIIYTIIKYEVSTYQRDRRDLLMHLKENSEIVASVIDLCITNELQTRLVGKSMYNEGFKNLKLLKRQIYPYFLMYLGSGREELVSYMMRDSIVFDIDKYPIETELRTFDLYGFIEFCCKHQKYIIRLGSLNNNN